MKTKLLTFILAAALMVCACACAADIAETNSNEESSKQTVSAESSKSVSAASSEESVASEETSTVSEESDDTSTDEDVATSSEEGAEESDESSVTEESSLDTSDEIEETSPGPEEEPKRETQDSPKEESSKPVESPPEPVDQVVSEPKEEEPPKVVEKEESDLPRSYILDVKNIMQNPELPTGCEITSLTIVLNHLGFNVDKLYMANNYLTKGKIGTVFPWDAFLGDPTSSHSYGCYAPVIEKDANRFLSDNGSDLKAYDISGAEFEDVLKELTNGQPIVIWATINMAQSKLTTSWTIDGEKFTWRGNEHCLVLTGYDMDKGLVYVADPLKGNTSYKFDVFKDRFNQMYQQAVVIK